MLDDPKFAACRKKLYSMVALIFLCGTVTGGFATHVAERYWLRAPNLVLSEAEKAMAVQHFSQELQLDPQQAKAIEDILDEFIMQQANLMAEFRTSRLLGHDRILQVLNEDQRRRFQKVLSELGDKRRD